MPLPAIRKSTIDGIDCLIIGTNIVPHAKVGSLRVFNGMVEVYVTSGGQAGGAYFQTTATPADLDAYIATGK